MRIKAKNFRQHKHFDITTNDTGLIQLTGKSGIGKTSVFDAIEEALYGTADDVYEWESTNKSMTVELWLPLYDDLYIKRTRGPGSLTVTSSKLQEPLLDSAAQAHINSLLNMNNDEFEASSYIKQGQSNSLLSLGATDQMKFIQKLSSGEMDEEAFKAHVNEAAKKEALEISLAETAIKQAQVKIDATKSVIDMITAIPVPDAPERSLEDAEYDRALRNVQRLVFIDEMNERNRLLGQIKSQESEKQQRHDTIQKVYGLSSTITELTDENINLNNKLKLLPSYEDTQCKIGLLAQYSSYTLIKDEMIMLAKEIRSRYIGAPQDLIGFLIEAQLLESEAFDKLRDEHSECLAQLSELQKYKHPQDCPHCAESIYVVSGKLMASPIGNTDEILLKINEKLDILKSAMRNNQSLLSELNKWITQGKSLKEKLINLASKEPVPTESMQYLQGVIQERASLSRDIQNIESRISATVMKKKALEVDLSCIKIFEGTEGVSYEEIAEKILVLTKSLSDLDMADAQSEAVIMAWKQYTKAMETVQSRYPTLVANTHIKSEAEEFLNESSLRLEKAKEKHESLLIIKSACDKASMASLEHIIDLINQNTKTYIDSMFEEDGTVISLNNSTTTQKGEDRAKISVDVYHKGKKAKSVKSLSGGEKSRATLAFQLGLSEMYNSPILLVDEGFTGIGKEAQEECIEVLRGFSTSRLVIVIEHGASEHLFDQQVILGG